VHGHGVGPDRRGAPARRDRGTLSGVGRVWSVVLLFNLLGALVFARAAMRTEVFPSDVREAFAELGLEAMRSGFSLTLLRGCSAAG
jgi:formate/nitrite transporter FocA (FNT family)